MSVTVDTVPPVSPNPIDTISVWEPLTAFDTVPENDVALVEFRVPFATRWTKPPPAVVPPVPTNPATGTPGVTGKYDVSLNSPPPPPPALPVLVRFPPRPPAPHFFAWTAVTPAGGLKLILPGAE